MNRRLVSIALPLLFGASLSAQAPLAPTAPAALPRRVPLHGSPHDPGYGLWAAGPTYKASFHDGFVFYPVLGDGRPENLPVRWTTTSVRAGELELATKSERRPIVQGSWNCEYELGSVVECYELREDGVEQSFVVGEKPEAGDLVIEGRLESKLRAQLACDGSRELHFLDTNGDPIVRYGEATAIDARGATFPVATELDGNSIRLRLGADSMARASFPLVVDPLVARWGIDMIDPVVNTDVGCDHLTNGPNTMLAMEVAVSASDHDLYFAVGTSTFASFGWALQLLNITDQRDPAVAFVAGASRWICTYSEAADDVYAYVHPRNNAVPNSGGAPFLVTSSGVQADVGGSLSSFVDDALVVFRSTSLNDPRIFGRTVNLATKALGFDFAIASTVSPATLDRRHPSVNQTSISNGWAVAWEEADSPQALSRIRVNLVFADRTIKGDAVVSFQHGSPFVEAKRPQIAGTFGRYVVSYVAGGAANTDGGTAIHAVRFDWAAASSWPTVLSQELLATAATLSTLSGVALAFDHGTQSHWCLFHRRSSVLGGSGALYRLGYGGGGVASTTVAPGNGATQLSATAATFDGVLDRFAISYGTNESSEPAFVQWLEYDGSHSLYGASCGGAISVTREPNAGHELFRVSLSQATGATAAWLLIGISPANLPLDGLGMSGCTLLVDPTVLITLPSNVVNGSSSLTIPLPDDPPFFGDADCQWLILNPGANPANLTATGGLLLHVR